MLGVDSDLGGGLQLHSDINIGVFAPADLNNCQSRTEAWQLLGQLGDFLLQILANFPANEKFSINSTDTLQRQHLENASDVTIVTNRRDNSLPMFIS